MGVSVIPQDERKAGPHWVLEGRGVKRWGCFAKSFEKRGGIDYLPFSAGDWCG